MLFAMIHFFLSLGVSERGVCVGGVIFKSSGIGKSTPINNASPDPKVGKNDSILLLIEEAALSTAFLSCSLIKRCIMNVPIWLSMPNGISLGI